MRSEFAVNFSLLHSFLLVLARVAGAFIFVPLPGVKNAPEMSRAVLILAIAMALYPVWPHVSGEPVLSTWLGSVVVEATFGLCIGLLVGFIAEVLVVFGQIAGLQAGYSFASTVDPSTQADSTILTVLAESMGSLLFVSFGLHREVIRIFAGSLETLPPGILQTDLRWAEIVITACSTIFSVGLRLALPIVALLMMVDIALALMGRLNAHLQLLSLAFPLKMLASLAILGSLAALMPSIYPGIARPMIAAAEALSRK